MANLLDVIQQLFAGGEQPTNRLAMAGSSGADPYVGWQRGLGSDGGGMPMPQMPQAAPAMPAPVSAAPDTLQPAPPSPQPSGGSFLSGLFGQGQGSREKLAAQYLQRQGMDGGMARLVARDPQLLRAVVGQSLSGGGEGFTLSPGQVRYDAQGNVVARGGPEEEKNLTDDIREYNFAVGNGQFKGSFTDWQTKGIREQDPTFSREMDLRKEYDLLPEVKDYKVVRSNFERIRQGVHLSTGAGDAAIVFGYMKMLDPTSVVREGEQATARNAAGVPESIRGMYNQLVGGGQISTEARNQILDAAEKVYAEASANIEDVNKRYSDFANTYKLEPGRIVSPVEQYDPVQQQTPDRLPMPQERAPLAAPAAPSPAPAVPSPDGVMDWQDWLAPGRRR